ncbi:MAG: hypothetical protein E6J70_12645 [Deltaproteobacteria bacterium]|nr:MAG: hypothetical protein E6J70_12645 [Deltaproteobacteria bacterium]
MGRALRRPPGVCGPRGAALGAQELRPVPVSALAGVRVLDLTRFLAGPFCTAILADLGAEVIKVEAPRGGDEGRYGYPTADGVPVAFLALNRNKKGIALDVRQEEGRRLLRRLLAHVDVLAENFAGGTLASWGLAPDDLPGRPGPPTTSWPRRRAASCRSRAFPRARRRAAEAPSATSSRASTARSASSPRSRLEAVPARGRRSTSPARTRCSRSSTAGPPSTRRPGGCRRGSGTATSRPLPTMPTGRATAGW